MSGERKMVKPSQNKGWTLIELLIVIIILGILGAIALPSMLNQRAKAEEAGALSQVGTVNRAQQAHRLENDEFASNMTDLGLNLPSTTQGYTYRIARADSVEAVYQARSVTHRDRKSFTGCVAVVDGGTNASIIASATNTNTPPACP